MTDFITTTSSLENHNTNINSAFPVWRYVAIVIINFYYIYICNYKTPKSVFTWRYYVNLGRLRVAWASYIKKTFFSYIRHLLI